MTTQQILEKITIIGNSSAGIDIGGLASLLSSLSEKIEKLEGKKKHDFAQAYEIGFNHSTMLRNKDPRIHTTTGEPYLGAGGGKLVEEKHSPTSNFIQMGDTVVCGHCKPGQFAKIEDIAPNVKCLCRCHTPTPPEKDKWYITCCGQVLQLPKSEKTDARSKFLGSYETKEDAEMVVEQIKSKYADN